MIELIKDGQVITDAQFLELHPNISFPTQIPFEDYGYSVIFPKPQPVFDKYTQKVVPAAPVLNQLNKYEKAWQIVDLSIEEITNNLQIVKNLKIQELKDRYILVNFSSIDHAGYTWNADQGRQSLLSQILSVGAVPIGMVWNDSSNISHSVTYQELQSLALAILERGLNAYQNMQTKISNVYTASTIAEVNAIIW